jgi:hypothetical protein
MKEGWVLFEVWQRRAFVGVFEVVVEAEGDVETVDFPASLPWVSQ